jgi:hypothetical protein
VPTEFARAVRWLESNTRPVGDLADPATLRAVMGAIGRKLDGRPAAASTSQRKRAVFHNALEYAVERKLLVSPLAAIRVTNRKTVEEVDRQPVQYLSSQVEQTIRPSRSSKFGLGSCSTEPRHALCRMCAQMLQASEPRGTVCAGPNAGGGADRAALSRRWRGGSNSCGQNPGPLCPYSGARVTN